MQYHFLVGNDNGNSEHDIYIDGRLFQQPNVNCAVDQLPWSEEQAPETIVRNLQENLIVTIDSPAARAGMYYVGKFALESGELIENIQVGVDYKYEIDLPVVNTLAQIAAVAVQKDLQKKRSCLPPSMYRPIWQLHFRLPSILTNLQQNLKSAS